MKKQAHSLNVSYYPRANTRRPVLQAWDGHKPIFIGHPFRWVLERTDEGIRIRDLRAKGQSKVLMESFDGSKPLMLELGTGEKIVVSRLRTAKPVYSAESKAEGDRILSFLCRGDAILKEETIESWPFTARTPSGISAFDLKQSTGGFEAVFSSGKGLAISKKDLFVAGIEAEGFTWRFAPADKTNVPFHESTDQQSAAFIRSVKGSMGTFAVMMLMVFIIPLLMPKEDDKKEELVPQKFAKIIMMKPKPPSEAAKSIAKAQSAPSSASGGNASQKASNTAVAQAFRTKAVQNAINGLLKGGLAKFALSTAPKTAGRMLASVGESGGPGVALGQVANAMLGSQNIGVGSVGGGSGYGQGTHAGVNGQGSGQVGLDTAGAEVDEGLTKEEVGRVIHAHMSEIRYCYESAMMGNPNLEGKLMVDFKIGPDGMVKAAAEKENGVNDPRVGSCVIRRLQTWPFPHPRGGVTVSVSYPFLFKSLKR